MASVSGANYNGLSSIVVDEDEMHALMSVFFHNPGIVSDYPALSSLIDELGVTNALDSWRNDPTTTTNNDL